MIGCSKGNIFLFEKIANKHSLKLRVAEAYNEFINEGDSKFLVHNLERVNSYIVKGEKIYFLFELDSTKKVVIIILKEHKAQIDKEAFLIVQNIIHELFYELSCVEFIKFSNAKNEKVDFMWDDEFLREIFPDLKIFALSNEPILLIGETGSGKEVISRFIHFLSKRRDGPFYPINCSSFTSEDLIQSELFGHEKGAFTGAVKKTPGILKSADGGTVFLDEIQSSAPRFQNCLLRFIDNGEIRILGSERIERANVRLIIACSSFPEKLLEEGKLILSFYHRICPLQINVPSLKERQDVMNYIYFFIFKSLMEEDIKIKDIKEESLEALRKYHWPGNIRELKGMIRKLILLSKARTTKIEYLLEEIINQRKTISSNNLYELFAERESFSERLLRFSREEIRRSLIKHGGNVSRTAKALGISRQSLQYRIKKYKLDDKAKIRK